MVRSLGGQPKVWSNSTIPPPQPETEAEEPILVCERQIAVCEAELEAAKNTPQQAVKEAELSDLKRHHTVLQGFALRRVLPYEKPVRDPDGTLRHEGAGPGLTKQLKQLVEQVGSQPIGHRPIRACVT